jgi:succinate dehydrogenase/fumarate reductase-like Fe-S protein
VKFTEVRHLAKVKIRRRKPSNPESYFETFDVPIQPGTNVLGVLNYIRENFDSSLAYYVECRHGRCAECNVVINGRVGLACMTAASGDMTIEPIKGYEVIRDLLVDTDRRIPCST